MMATKPPFPMDLVIARMTKAQRARFFRYMRRTMRLPAPDSYCGMKRTLDHMQRFAVDCLTWKPKR